MRPNLKHPIFRNSWFYVVLFSVTSLASSLPIIIHYHKQSANVEIANECLENFEKAHKALGQIERELESARSVVDRIKEKLATGISNDSLETYMKTGFLEEDQYLNVTVAFDPSSISDTTHYAPFLNQNDSGKWVTPQIPYAYYSDTCSLPNNWYLQPFENKMAMLIEPYRGAAAKKNLVAYSEYFELADGRNGVICIDFPLDEFNARLDSLNFNKTGYNYVLSDSGRIIYFPLEEEIQKHYTKVDSWENIFWDRSDTTYEKSKSCNGFFTVYDSTVNERKLYFSSPIQLDSVFGTWNFGLVMTQDEALNPTEKARKRKNIRLVSYWMLFLVSLSFLGYSLTPASNWSLWATTSVISLVGVGGILAVWYFSMRIDSESGFDDDPLLNNLTTQLILNKEYENDGIKPEQFIEHVDTIGIFVQSLEFKGVANVNLTGFLWVRNRDEKDTVLSQAVFFPEAVNMEVEPIELSHDTSRNVWFFDVELRQNFNNSTYPLDRETVWIRLWDGSLDQNILFHPDFEAYDTMDPDSLPGLVKDIILEGWTVTKSYFSYEKRHQKSNFGLHENKSNTFAELKYNISIRRDFTGAFVSHLIPLFVVAFLVFIVLTTLGKYDKKHENLELAGFSASNVLAYCSSLFFVLIVSHVYLRNSLVSSGIIYMEWFYFVMYAVILAVSVIAILFVSNINMGWLAYKNCLIIKVLYWPVIVYGILAFTIFKFYTTS